MALILFWGDHATSFFAPLRYGLSFVVLPLQYAVDLPVRFIGNLNAHLVTREKLLEENAHLRAQERLLRARMQKWLALQKENRELRALFRSFSNTPYRLKVAQILSLHRDASRQTVLLNVGAKDGAYVGQPVLGAEGVFGQIIQVGYLTSEVMLLTDGQSAIPVQDPRNGQRGLVKGMAIQQGGLRLADMPKTADIQPGDAFITSGLGGTFPPGFPVATVVKVNKKPNAAFAEITLLPKARLNRDRLVMLLWPGFPGKEQQHGT